MSQIWLVRCLLDKKGYYKVRISMNVYRVPIYSEYATMSSYVTVSIVIFIIRLDHLKASASVSRDRLEIILIEPCIAFYKYV